MSNNNHHIPESEQELAQQVGTVLEEGRSVLSIEDPLMDQIVDHKKDLYSTFESELSESKSKSWEAIAGVIQKDLNEETASNSEKSSTRTIKFRRSTFLKVAATVLFAVLISVIYLQFQSDQPTIVAQSGSSQMVYTLNDQSRVQLRPNSTLSIVEQSDVLVRYELEGEAFFDVTRNQNRRFLVDAGPGQIEVIGTSFNIREWGGETVVYLKDGSLALHSSNEMKEVFLKSGEMATVSSGSNITDPVSTDGQEYISWQNDELILNGRTVASVISELEYHYSIEIQAPEGLKREVLGGTLSLESQEVSLENLGIVLSGNFSSIGDDTYQFVE